MIAIMTQERLDRLVSDTVYLAALTINVFEKLEKKYPRLFDDDMKTLRDEVKKKFMLDQPPEPE